MVPNRNVHAILLTFLCSLMGICTPTAGINHDVACLKSIKESLEDPSGLLSSWEFDNATEGFICNFVGVSCWHDYENKVIELLLRDMGLRGQFPRGVGNCTSLTTLDLSGNELRGPIPYNIAGIIPFVTKLDLSSNNFTGEIPEAIANCSYLGVLRLDNNSLTGQIPSQIGLLGRLKSFSVTNNKLSGPLPHSMSVFSADSYANNSGLCGQPLERCKQVGTKFDWSFKGGFMMGYAISAISAIVVYASYCVPWVSIGNRNQLITIPEMVKLMVRNNKKPQFDYLANLSTLDFLVEKEISTSENFVTRMSFKDLCHATNNFSRYNIIGFGRTGTTYMATLSNGWSLAVKKFSSSEQSEDYFITELKTLRKLRHDNLVPLIGFCKQSKKRLLVHKYISNGNLFDWLHSMGDKILEWPLRMKVAAGLARVLAWLHHCCDIRVAHLSITSKSVLLDQNFEPKLSNFGMATLINPKEINSSRGFYMDMEFWEECFLKEDVFSFGIVLLELITGRTADSLDCYDSNLNRLTSGIRSSSSGLYDGIDEVLIGKGHDSQILECLRIARNCVQPFPEQRPSMLDVYTTISIIKDKATQMIK